MPTLEDLRQEANLSATALARNAKVSFMTVRRALNGGPVQKIKALIILDALSKELGRPIKLEDIEGLRLAATTP